MLVTLDVSHFEISLLNAEVPEANTIQKRNNKIKSISEKERK